MILSLFFSLASLTECTNVWSQNHLGLNPAPPTNFDRLTYQKSMNRDPVPIPGTVSSLAAVPKGNHRQMTVQQSQVSKKQQPQVASSKVNLFEINPSRSQSTTPQSSGRVRAAGTLPSPVDDNAFVYTNLTANSWTEFYFIEPNQLPYSRWQFSVATGQQCTLQVTDAYCTGDRFQAVRVYSNDTEGVLFDTPPVPYDPVVAAEIKAGNNVNCTPFTTDPATAWSSPSWSKNQQSLTAGSYRLILKPLLAPYGAGGAYVRLNCASTPAPTPVPAQTCTYNGSSIKYLNRQVAWNQIASVCSSAGLTPLAVTSANLEQSLQVLFNCGGSNARAWVGSYNGDTYEGRVGLFLHSGATMGSGGLTATPETNILYSVMCQ
jgi:hypothetical protein